MTTRHDRADVSRAIFGNRYLASVLAVAAELAREGEWITTRRVAARVGIADSIARAALLRLVAGGVVWPLMRDRGARGQQYYEVRDTALARAVVAAAVAVVGERESPPVGSEP